MPCLPAKRALQKSISALVEDVHGPQVAEAGIDSGHACMRDVEATMKAALRRCHWETQPDGTHVKYVRSVTL